ncbi:MAG TPA: protein kinase [Candidatus Limnocylindria bacterium]|nr:protein kinase [Candidatus Limnocylindria bacterium]
MQDLDERPGRAVSDPEERYDLGPEVAELPSSRIFAATARATGAPVFVQLLSRGEEELAALADALEKGARALSDAGVPGRPVEWNVTSRPGWIVYDQHGEPLASAVRRGRDPGLVDSVAIETAVALEVLGKVGLTHRAVNPRTLFHQNRRIALLGLDALRASYVSARGDKTAPNDPRYTAPEAFDGGGDIKADVYSLGCVLFALMTGAPPYFGSAEVLRAAHRSEPIPTVPGDDAVGWNELLAKMLAKEPAARPQPGDIAGHVRKARQRAAFVMPAAPVVTRLKRKRSRAPLVMAGAALVLLLLGGVGAMALLRPSAPAADPGTSAAPTATAPVAAASPTVAASATTPEPTAAPPGAATAAPTNAPGAVVTPRPTVARTPTPPPPPISQVSPAAGPRGTIFSFAVGGFPAGAVFVQSYSDATGFQSNPVPSGVVGQDGVARTTLRADGNMQTGPHALRITAGGISRVVTFQITP